MREGEEEVNTIAEVFRQFDADGSGTITRDELVHVMRDLCGDLPKADIDRIMDEVDTNGDGEIDYDEFAAWLTKPAAASKSASDAIVDYSAALRLLFDVYDRDGNGHIELKEFTECHGIVVAALNMHLGDSAKVDTLNCSLDAETVFEHIDSDGNKQLSFSEFLEWMREQFTNSGIPTSEIVEFLEGLARMLGGVFKIADKVLEPSTASAEDLVALETMVKSIAESVENIDNARRRRSRLGSCGWTEPPAGLSIERLRGTHTCLHPLNTRLVAQVEDMEILCVPMSSESKSCLFRPWIAEVRRRLKMKNGDIKLEVPAYYEYRREEMKWTLLKGQQRSDFMAALEALPVEMRLFCLLKTEANFGMELRWKQIQSSLNSAVGMDLLSRKNADIVLQHFTTMAEYALRQEGTIDRSDCEAHIKNEVGQFLANNLKLRPRQVMAVLSKLNIMKTSDVWAQFVDNE
eukprot:TRINITY_DN3780_c0_g5_i1.p1 TRINITY_DN3780_c0_g5~~TRINITY_DN3780_c0_g5_i1.p1  ORF type:complete len:474 (-),score=78.58 TRINITY_DN3780_c0_g5_i1:66-1451(-)